MDRPGAVRPIDLLSRRRADRTVRDRTAGGMSVRSSVDPAVSGQSSTGPGLASAASLRQIHRLSIATLIDFFRLAMAAAAAEPLEDGLAKE